ncbi:hypothetical protein I6H59_00390 (plasmid) [Lactococcus garvieae]|nr:hypothetical protein I6H59_00390 [Lactococcus garvieae]CEF52306.1 Oligoendopeptidase F, plasmid [Lactococcus garvieae]
MSLDKLYPSINAWIDDINIYKKSLEDIHFPELKVENIIKILNLIDENAQYLDKLYTYGVVKREFDVSDKTVNDYILEVRKLYSSFNEKIKSINTFVKNNKSHILQNLKKSNQGKIWIQYISKIQNNVNNVQYNLSKRIDPYGDYVNWYNSLDDIGNIIFDKYILKIKESNLLELLKSDDYEFRRKIYLKVEEELKRNSKIASILLNSHLQINCLVKEPYHKFISNGIIGKDSVSFLEKSKNSIVKLSHDIVKNKIKLVQAPSFSYSDMYYLPTESDNLISFDEAKRIVYSTFATFGDTISTICYKALYEGWIITERTENSHSGQRSYSSYSSHPYIKIDWHNRIDDLFDLTHEIGGAISQFLSSKNGKFLYSETSILKTEFFSILGTICLCDNLKRNFQEKFNKKLVTSRIIDFYKDILILPFEFCYVEEELYNRASQYKLTEGSISDIWYSVVSDFHNIAGFKPMIENKSNWVRHDQFYLNGYSFKYIESLILAEKYYEIFNETNSDVLVNLFKKGEQLSDLDFFYSLMGEKEIDFEYELNKTIKKISNIIKENIYEKNDDL